MKTKPAGSKFRNLYAYRGSVWYERHVGAKRYRLDLETESWHEGAERRDAWEQLKGIPAQRERSASRQIPTLADFAERYLEGDVAHLAETTRSDRASYLAEHGPLIRHLGELRLDEIDAAALRRWWVAVVETPFRGANGTERRRSTATGRHYLNVLAAVLGFARDLGIIDTAPGGRLPRAGSAAAAGRSAGAQQTAPDRNIHPVGNPRELGRIVFEARAEGAAALAFVLLQLDAGLRQGEALGLRWGRVAWGAGPDDMLRHLVIDSTRPRGWNLENEAPKSGRERRVALSCRLHLALGALYRARFEPGPEALVLEGIDPGNFRHRDWRRILGRAGVAYRPLKDLRDTFASQLLTAGVQLGYVSAQLGHADATTTTEHYAKWCGGDEYRAPVVPLDGELPADLLGRIAPEVAPDLPLLPTEVPTAERPREARSPNSRPLL